MEPQTVPTSKKKRVLFYFIISIITILVLFAVIRFLIPFIRYQLSVVNINRTLNQIGKINQQELNARRDKIVNIKTNLPQGKEVFDIRKFVNLYGLDQSKFPPPEMENFESQYYLDYPYIKTIADFVKKRQLLDSYDAN